jgi:ligand-binding SRPBCC domain-containing protein
MRLEQSFTVGRPPGEVFAYMVEPANLASWQTSKVSVEPLTDGPPRQGYRIKERTKIGLRQWDQVVELSEFDPGRALSTHIVEGPMPVDGRWTMQADDGDGTHVKFVAEGQLTGPMRLLEPLVRRGIARSFRHYHALLARNVETAAAGPAHHEGSVRASPF